MTAWSRWAPLQVRRRSWIPVERSRRVILGAVLDELGEVGYGALTIEAVAAQAGVGKSTIYRHWPGKRLVGRVPDAQGAGRGARSGSAWPRRRGR